MAAANLHEGAEVCCRMERTYELYLGRRSPFAPTANAAFSLDDLRMEALLVLRTKKCPQFTKAQTVAIFTTSVFDAHKQPFIKHPTLPSHMEAENALGSDKDEHFY